ILGVVADGRPDEVRPVLLMFAHSFLLGFAYTLYETIADAMFLTHYGAQALPYVYLAGTAVCVAAVYGYSRLETRVRPASLFLGLLTTFLATLLLTRAGFWFAEARLVAVVMRVACGLLYLLIELEFWSLAGALFTLRQGKRLFPLIGAGEVL